MRFVQQKFRNILTKDLVFGSKPMDKTSAWFIFPVQIQPGNRRNNAYPTAIANHVSLICLCDWSVLGLQDDGGALTAYSLQKFHP